MQNKLCNMINVSTRILIIFLLSLSMFMANSIYLIFFMSILFVFLSILAEKSVKIYVYFLKKIKFWLLFAFIIYIIIFRDIISAIIFLYKILVITLFIIQFSLNINFQSLNNGIKTLFRPLYKTNINCDKISYNITITIYFLYFYMISLEQVNEIYTKNNKFSLKYNILPRIFLSINNIEKLEKSLSLKHYKPKFEKNDIKSNLLLFISLLFFVIVFVKEVVL